MGLDMHLFAEQTIPIWEEEGQQLKRAITEAVGSSVPDFLKDRLRGLKFEAMYWRKSNHIHAWFVKNVQAGTDDCGYYPVSRDDLEQLVLACEQVLDDHTLADQLLPRQGGFFFGSTDYTEYYYEDLKSTRDQLKQLLSEPNLRFVDFTYHSSW